MEKMTKQDWISAISNMFQFILGFLLGVTLIAGSAIGAAYYYFRKVSSSAPEKPVYTEESASKSTASQEESKSDSPEISSSQNNSKDNSKSETTATEELPPNAYYAKVTWPQGLSLRAEPDPNAARVGGVSYDAKILILEESTDKNWQKIRIPWSEQEGWVKAGNIKRTSY